MYVTKYISKDTCVPKRYPNEPILINWEVYTGAWIVWVIVFAATSFGPKSIQWFTYLTSIAPLGFSIALLVKALATDKDNEY